VLEVARGKPGEDYGADADHAWSMGRHRLDRRPNEVLCKAAKPGQAVHGHAGHLARKLPAEELHAGLSHSCKFLCAAGASVSGLVVVMAGLVPATSLRDARRCHAKRVTGTGP